MHFGVGLAVGFSGLQILWYCFFSDPALSTFRRVFVSETLLPADVDSGRWWTAEFIGSSPADEGGSVIKLRVDSGCSDCIWSRQQSADHTHWLHGEIHTVRLLNSWLQQIELMESEHNTRRYTSRRLLCCDTQKGENFQPCWECRTKESSIEQWICSALSCQNRLGARFTQYLLTVLQLSYDNDKVTIDLWQTSNLQNIPQRMQGFS